MSLRARVGLVVVLAEVGSWWLIPRELQPIDRIIGTASGIGEVGLDRRLPEAATSIEFVRLSPSLDRIERASPLQERRAMKVLAWADPVSARAAD